jgi:DNA repair exonuclease SbcCD ATPase subunit
MVQNVTQKVAELILQFSVPSETRKEIFTKGMERAAVFCMAELERRKGSGFVLKRTPREFAFIVEVCYPFWLVPWGERSLVFDGLKATSYTLFYHVVPNVETFLNGVNRSSATREAYATFLSDNLNYFQTSENQKEKLIDGLLTDPHFLQDFNLYLAEAEQVKPPLSNIVLLAPTLAENTIFSIKRELENLRTQFTKDANSLYKGMKLLNATTKRYIAMIQTEIKEIEKEFNEKLEKRKPAVMERVEQIRRQYDAQVTRVSKRFEKELYHLHQERAKLEKTKALLVSKIERCEAEIETCIVNKDTTGERKWKEELEQHKKELSKVEKEIKEAEERIKVPENAKKQEISRLKAECETRVDEATWELKEIEASRDAKIRIYEKEMKNLEEKTTTIIGQMDKLAKLREATLNQLNKLGVRQKHNKCTLVHMPFYVVCYRIESKRQYAVYPPSIANSMKLSIKLKGTLGRAKIKQLLAQRSKAISSLIGKFPVLLEQNAVFEREINEAGVKANIIGETLRESVRNGLEKLREEGWLSKEELETFSQILT